MSAARYLLDEEHQRLLRKQGDPNQYILGEIEGHNIVIAALPFGYQGTTPAAIVAKDMIRTFPSISLRLLVGIGGGVPSEKNDIRLGDVIIGTPMGTYGGVVEYDLGKQTPTGFKRKGFLCPPPTEWLHTITRMKSDHRRSPSRVSSFFNEMLEKHRPSLIEYKRPPPDLDVLFEDEYTHIEPFDTCDNCDITRIKKRATRDSLEEPCIHYGLIASGNRVMKDAMERKRISEESGGAICYEMEAAGLMNDFHCIVIRGVSDYSDSHKNDQWQPYAAAAAAALAKQLLTYMDDSTTAQEEEKGKQGSQCM